MLGEVALYSFLIVLLTGVFLTLFFNPSMTEVVYQGSYVPLRGVSMSEAYRSTLDISFDVRGGLLMRQVHHWGAMLFIASMTSEVVCWRMAGSVCGMRRRSSAKSLLPPV